MQNTKKMETVSKKNEAETEDVRILREETKKAFLYYTASCIALMMKNPQTRYWKRHAGWRT